ncbi:MAG: lytic transglycosylase domain-containing protein, partial [Rickettsiaceae bacterium]|nr:lytic transglycosylase domain-containing protein [Rickettsiaceae bacterium]
EICDLVDAEWFAGWLAFRFEKKPEKAQKHFLVVYNSSKSSISKARGAYWLGRVYQKLKNDQQAEKFYKLAAEYGFTYYGMLASSELGHKNLSIKSPPEILEQDKLSLSKNQYAQIAEFFCYSSKQEMIKYYAKQAFMSAKSKGEIALLHSRLRKNLDLHWRVEVAKLASQAGLLILEDSFPLPYKIPKNVLEVPLVYAIMRQESVFDVKATSYADAQGLMQIRPATAKALAQELGIKYEPGKIYNPEYNIKLGSYYLERELKANDSYIKTACEYNAGPVSKKWDERFGNPNGMKLRQVIDWVELIPYEQTRTYVQRIIENMQIYRYVIQNDKRLHIARDLTRG